MLSLHILQRSYFSVPLNPTEIKSVFKNSSTLSVQSLDCEFPELEVLHERKQVPEDEKYSQHYQDPGNVLCPLKVNC